MTTPTSPSTGPAEAAVLLVLLPVTMGTTHTAQNALNADLNALQHKLGSIIRLLRIPETSHPAVVRSFQPDELPAMVLVQQGVEIWRQQGLPDGDAIIPLLMSKIQPLNNTTTLIS
ncbi:thioredoxin [Hymenobacter guriensis]|uniref:Thioredoxin n=1 Tax=Hymenobacter guriensis TaxID=2793065 RepID=A0ABS0L9L1_9BACT|nr:thioredoxin [Hymenobacter guriensis]MBG8556259.1 thioredoxin [Hymenobacter guriensis]